MDQKIPEEVLDAVRLIDQSDDYSDSIDRVRHFKDGIYILNDCITGFPEMKKDIHDIKYRKTLSLLSGLEGTANNLNQKEWEEYVFLFCIDLRDEILMIKKKEPEFYMFFLEFISVHFDSAEIELQQNIKEFIDK